METRRIFLDHCETHAFKGWQRGGRCPRSRNSEPAALWLLCGYGFALFGWRSRGGGEALDAFPGLAVSRSYCDVLVCLSCIQGERQDRRRLRSYNNELAVLSMVVPS